MMRARRTLSSRTNPRRSTDEVSHSVSALPPRRERGSVLRHGSRGRRTALGGAVLAVAAGATALLVGAALRPPAKPTVRLAPTAAAVAVADDRVWRWFGAADCSRTAEG